MGAALGRGPDDVRGISELAQRIVTSTYLHHPRLHRVLMVVLGVLMGVCVVATVTRLSPLPLLPVPLLAVAGYALRQARADPEDRRRVLAWSCLFLAATLVAFWLMSVVARWLD
jgi:hypothetical protein